MNHLEEPIILFETKFASVYQRNNKAKSKSSSSPPTTTTAVNKTGMKNMRCFPCHSPQGHMPNGFCGSSISLLIHHPPTSQILRLWGQFELLDSPPEFTKGQFASLAVITSTLERSRFARNKPWLPSVQLPTSSSSGIRFVLNMERLGYNYGWVSNVHSSESLHCLRVYLFQHSSSEGDQDRLECIAVSHSTPFKIICSRSNARLHEHQCPPAPAPPPLVKRFKLDVLEQRTVESLLSLSSA